MNNPSEIQDVKLQTQDSSLRRRPRSRIAHLPEAIRNQLNTMLRDGLTYPEIIEKLGPDGKDLNEDNLSHWYSGPYQDWLKDQHWLEQMHDRLQFADDVLQVDDTTKIHEASLLIAVKQMYTLIADFDPAAFMQQLAEDPASYARILNSLSKLTEEALKYQRHRAEQAHRKAQLEKAAADAKTLGLTDPTRRSIEEEFNLI